MLLEHRRFIITVDTTTGDGIYDIMANVKKLPR